MVAVKLAALAGEAMSFDGLRRPLPADEPRGLDSHFYVAQLFKAIAAKFGERVAEEVAQELFWSWMLESMEASLLDAETGPLPRFIRRLERSTQLYNHHVR